MSEWISEKEWETIVRNAPIVSVDLVVKHSDGIVLGKRTNEPAKGSGSFPVDECKKVKPELKLSIESQKGNSTSRLR